MTGRKQYSVWEHFKKIKIQCRTGCRVMYLHCSKVMEGQTKRMESHFEACQKRQDDEI